MTATVAGIDPHRDSFMVAVIDGAEIEVENRCFSNTGSGYGEAIEWLERHGPVRVGIEGTGSWGAHIAVALVGAGFDVREVPPQRSAIQRRARRASKTDRGDAVAAARATLADPELGPAQALELYDPVVAEIEAVLAHRRMLVTTRTLGIHHLGAQIEKLPPVVRDRLNLARSIEARLNQLAELDIDSQGLSGAAQRRLGWLIEFAIADRCTRRLIRDLESELADLLDAHGTTLRDEVGIGVVNAATLLCEVGDPTRFDRESKFARWCGTGAVAVSTGEGDGEPKRHRLDTGGNRRINCVTHTMSVTQSRQHPDARAFLERKRQEGKTKREARRAHKRHLANRIIRRMWRDEQTRRCQTTPHC